MISSKDPAKFQLLDSLIFSGNDPQLLTAHENYPLSSYNQEINLQIVNTQDILKYD